MRSRSRTEPTRRGRLALWLLLGLAGCWLRGPLRLSPHLGAAAGEPSATPLRLAIAPFRDARMPLSREGVRPAPRLALLGVSVVGEYATGDASFGGSLADHARRDAAATLAHSGLFSEVRLLEPGSLGGDPAGGERSWDLLLQGEIEELVGFQNRRFELNLLRLPPLRNQFDAPLGVARVGFRVLDPRGLARYERRVETQVQGRGLDIARAALDALAAADEELAHRLYRELAPPRPPRVIPLRVLDACGLGESRLAPLFEDASEVFEREAQLRLAPAFETWQKPTAASTPRRALRLLKRLAPPPGGILLGVLPYSDKSSPFQREPSGLAAQLGEHAVVSCAADATLRTVTILHEIGHLLGAVHVGDRSSIMYPIAEFDGRFFDATNRRILQLSRTRSFSGPLDPTLRTELRSLYAQLADTEAAPADDLRAALQAVEF